MSRAEQIRTYGYLLGTKPYQIGTCLYKACGRTPEEIAGCFGVPRSTVMKWLEKVGVEWYPAAYVDHGDGLYEVKGDRGRWHEVTVSCCRCEAGSQGQDCHHQQFVRRLQNLRREAA